MYYHITVGIFLFFVNKIFEVKFCYIFSGVPKIIE